MAGIGRSAVVTIIEAFTDLCSTVCTILLVQISAQFFFSKKVVHGILAVAEIWK